MFDAKDLAKKAFKFGIAGGLGTLTGLGVQYLTKELFGFWFMYAAIIGYFCGFFVNFFGNVVNKNIPISEKRLKSHIAQKEN